MRIALAPLAALLVALACTSPDSSEDAADTTPAGGTLVIASAAEAGNLLPPLVDDVSGKQVTDQVFDRLAEIGPELNTVGDRGFTGRLAQRWEWAADSMSIVFHLHPNARWHDGRPVRASDVRFTLSVYRDPAVASPHAQVITNVDSISVRDSLTAVVWYKQRTPEQFFQATHQLQILPEHLLRDIPRAQLATSTFMRNPVGSGRFRFARWDPGATIEIVADTGNYRGRPKLDRVIWSLAPDATAAATKLLAGEADIFEALPREQVPAVNKNPLLRTLRYPQLAYTYIGFNTRDSLFAERELRRALVMAVNRQTLVRSVFDSLAVVATGPFIKAAAPGVPDIRQIPYDTVQARAKLDSLGWRDANGDGVRERGGRPLRFSLLVPGTSAFRIRMALLLQEELRRVGVDMQIEQMDANLMASRQEARRFEAIFGGYVLDPSPSGVRQTFTTAATTGGYNYVGYANPRFDALIDSATTTMDPARARSYYGRAYELITQDAPVMFMYEFQGLAGVHRRLNISGMLPHAWWAGIADWSIPLDLRIRRDEIGLRAAPK